MSKREVINEDHDHQGLTFEEYERIKCLLGREPNETERGVFSVMWSEHCSYKSTRSLLKNLPTRSGKVLIKAGEENAGVLDIGDGLAIVFKIESHNHPSAVEPFQGAATGVGGILRDIFTMGARPICAANSLRFGSLQSSESRRLFREVVAGIGHYGNCFGVPILAGEVNFDPSYEGNPIVNAFALGVLQHGQIARAAAKGIGNPVFYVGPQTGRDGLAGAAFASKDLTEKSAKGQREAIQVGDPFMEKLLLEACLELLSTGAVAGIQDMGAAGLTCSTCEMASRGKTGIEIELDKVPTRSSGMTPYEILLSESQERMLIIIHKGKEAEVKRLFDKWDLPCAEIGFVTNTGKMQVKYHGKLVVDIFTKHLTEEVPMLSQKAQRPAYFEKTRLAFSDLRLQLSPFEVLQMLLAFPTIASKNWVYRQYDYSIGNGTAVSPGSDAAVFRVRSDSLPPMNRCSSSSSSKSYSSSSYSSSSFSEGFPEKILALSLDGNSSYVYLDPFEGGRIAVAEAARNLACSGAIPLGVSDNLNYGNPHDAGLFWQLEESIKGISEACEFFKIPVMSGNVSLYNQSSRGAIDPTPVIAMIGQVEDSNSIVTQWFKDEGDAILLLGGLFDECDLLQGLGGSAYLQVCEGKKAGQPPRVYLEKEKRIADVLRGWIASGIVKSAHDCSEGGLAVALCESSFEEVARSTIRLRGAKVRLPKQEGLCSHAALFGESQGRIIISVSPAFLPKVIGQAQILEVPLLKIGSVGGDHLKIDYGEESFCWELSDLHQLWWRSIEDRMESERD